MVRGASVAYARVGRVVIAVHPLKEPIDAEWAQYLDFLLDPGHRDTSVFVYSVGGGPNSRQRRALAERTNGIVLPTAVVTPSPITRAIGVAVSWFNPNIRMFSPTELQDALGHLKLDPLASTPVLLAARELANALSIRRAQLDLSLEHRTRRAV
jgi:hypothetical protein